jgi:activator of HSP90 ATPase
MKTITQKVQFKADPKELYELFLDSKKHSQATGGKAVIHGTLNGTFTAWDGYIQGKNVVLVPGRLIVQTWRTKEFEKEDLDSLLVLSFEKIPTGCRLTMVHTQIPDSQASHYSGGWREHYWRPIQKYLAKK